MEEISCYESTAPLEFDTDTLIESSSGLSVAVERCPLCSECKRPFYCQNCVGKGKFIHSTATYPDSYDDLHRKWERKKVEKEHLLERFKRETAFLHRIDDKKTAIDVCRRNIELLRKSIEATKHSVQKDKASHVQIRKENVLKYNKGKRHQDKRRTIVDYINKVTRAIAEKKEKLQARQNDLMELRKKQIADLTTFIFPVSEVKSKGDSMTMLGSDDVHLREAIQDASSTAYVHGRWIYANSQYRIVNPALPAHGDYSEYNIMVSTAIEDGATEAPSPTSPGNSIIAGLCYTSQLVALMSNILSISLPKKQNYSEFCVSDLPERQFNRAVVRLNKNILYLCFSQGVDTENIEPKHTLHNVVLLLRHTQLGRIGSFDIVQDMMDSLEDSNGHSEESDDESNNCLDEVDTRDWEAVPDNIPMPVVPPMSPAQEQAGFVSQDMTDSALTASGVLSSAFSTISSYFRR